jgi:uncharacterized protein with NRDE domain
MCLILVAYRAHGDYPVILAANRDEFFARESLPAAAWPESPDIIGGRDLEKGGSWLAVSAKGRLAAVTNFRDGARQKTGIRSRGLLVSDFMLSDLAPVEFLQQVHATRDCYDGFNLLVAADSGLFHYANVSGVVTAVAPGIHGLSNHLLDTPWPKVERGKAALHRLLGKPREALMDGLFGALAETAPPPDDALPRTGVSLEWERVLATALINTPEYGTRASTVVLMDGAGTTTLIERNLAPGGISTETRCFELAPAPTPLPIL